MATVSRIFPALLIIITLSCVQQKNFDAAITTDTLHIRSEDNLIDLSYNDVIKKQKDNTNDICICRALSFRVAQIMARHDTSDILDISQIASIETGWNTDGVTTFFRDVIKIPGSRFSIAQNAPSEQDLGLKDAWFQATYTDGTTVRIEARETLLPPRWFQLRAALIRGEKELHIDETAQIKEDTAQRLATLPLKGMFKIIPCSINQ